MHVVRVSSLTSKVIEASNYFTEKAGQALLVPIVKTKVLKEAPPEISTTAVTSSNFGNAKGDDQEKERATFAVSGKIKTAISASASVSVHDNRRMITFDSTDPEFDEDSDPDADLDL